MAVDMTSVDAAFAEDADEFYMSAQAQLDPAVALMFYIEAAASYELAGQGLKALLVFNMAVLAEAQAQREACCTCRGYGEQCPSCREFYGA